MSNPYRHRLKCTQRLNIFFGKTSHLIVWIISSQKIFDLVKSSNFYDPLNMTKFGSRPRKRGLGRAKVVTSNQYTFVVRVKPKMGVTQWRYRTKVESRPQLLFDSRLTTALALNPSILCYTRSNCEEKSFSRNSIKWIRIHWRSEESNFDSAVSPPHLSMFVRLATLNMRL